MSTPTITVPVDATNPGQFFACCGLLELADRLWPESDDRRAAEGWFADGQFYISCGGTLRELLQLARDAKLDDEPEDSDDEGSDEEGSDDDDTFIPLVLVKPVLLRLDWWQEKGLKTWAGSMKANLIFKAMFRAIDPECVDPLGQTQVVYNPPSFTKTGRPQKPKKREPFYLDARRGANALALDIGFMPDAHKELKTRAHPAVEFFALVGLQRCRPIPTPTPRVFDYFTWSVPCSPAVLPLAVCGLLGDPQAQGYRFENAFRTGQKKHKAFNPATPLGGSR